MRHVAIVGAAGGIGSACASAFEDAGWRVTGADLSGAETTLDVTNHAAVDAFARDVAPVDALVYAAGVVATSPVAEMAPEAWRRVLAVNLDGAAFCAGAFARVMEPGGVMVFVSSAAGLRGEANAAAYCASKFGLNGMVEAVAAELVPRGIRVNAVAPGNVGTPMLRQVAADIATATGSGEDEVWQDLGRTGAATRLVAAEEVAAACLSLCRPELSAVTGAVLRVDAGYLLS